MTVRQGAVRAPRGHRERLPLTWPGVEVSNTWGSDTTLRVSRFRGVDTMPDHPWVTLTAHGGSFTLQTYLDLPAVQTLIDGLTAWADHQRATADDPIATCTCGVEEATA